MCKGIICGLPWISIVGLMAMKSGMALSELILKTTIDEFPRKATTGIKRLSQPKGASEKGRKSYGIHLKFSPPVSKYFYKKIIEVYK